MATADPAASGNARFIPVHSTIYPVIVAFFVAPVVVNLLLLANSWLAEHAAWIDTGTSGTALLTNEWVSGEQWAQFGSATALWVLLPLAVGCWRVARKEVK